MTMHTAESYAQFVHQLNVETKREKTGVTVGGALTLALEMEDLEPVASPILWKGQLGTVTAHPQEGNPRPRLHRLLPERALVNRMGFNNAGSEDLARRLRALRDGGHWPRVPIGANVGKSAVTPLSEAVGDYVASVRRLAGLADWITVNVSSPNTVGLRGLQDRDALAALLPAVVAAAGCR